MVSSKQSRSLSYNWFLILGFLVFSTSVAISQVSAPVFTPETGAWPVAFNVTVTGTTPASTIYYTTDGSDPTTASTLISSGSTVRIQTSGTLKARAFTVSGSSALTTEEYRVTGMVSVGQNHAIGLRFDGKVYSWGSQDYGALGNGSTSASDLTSPTDFRKTGSTPFTNAEWVSAGYGHTLVVDQNGALWAAGRNSAGQLGINTTSSGTAYAVQVLSGTTPGVYLTGVAQAEAGEVFSVALLNSGEVRAWGDSSEGRLGNGTTSPDKLFPVAVTGTSGSNLTNIVQIAVGLDFSAALASDGKVWMWGNNGDGALGIGNVTDQTRATKTKVMVSGSAVDLTDVIDVSCGYNHTLFLRETGTTTTVWACGEQLYGKLGNNATATANVSYPTQVYSSSGTTTYLQNIVQVDAGKNMSLALDADGHVWSWGQGDQGALGNGSTADRAYADTVKVSGTTPLGNIVWISAGGSTYGCSLALAADGTLYAWGDNVTGLYGNGSKTDSNVAIQVASGVSFSNAPPVVSLSAPASVYSPNTPIPLTATASDAEGALTSVEIFQDGLLIGSGSSSPLNIEVPALAPGSYTFTAKARDSLGVSTTSNSVVVNVVIPAVSVVVLHPDYPSIVEGEYEQYPSHPEEFARFHFKRSDESSKVEALTLTFQTSGPATPGTDYEVFSGTATFGPGNSDIFVPLKPLKDRETEGDEAVIVTIQPSTNYVITASAATITIIDSPPTAKPVAAPDPSDWEGAEIVKIESATPGSGISGVNEDYTYTFFMYSGDLYRLIPSETITFHADALSGYYDSSDEITLTYPSGPKARISVSSNGFIARNSDGDVFLSCSGSLAINQMTGLVPGNVTGFENARGFSIGMNHVLAIKSDGTVWAAGSNIYGQVGTGTTSNVANFTQVSGLSDVVAVATGRSHSLALSGDGTVWTWGRNHMGQLGIGNTTDKTSPIQVPGLNYIVAIACGADHSAAIDQGGNLWLWGNNGSNQLSTTGTAKKSPVEYSLAPHSTLPRIVGVACGENYTLLLKSNGTVMSTGYIGSGLATSSTFSAVSGLSDIIDIRAGSNSAIALKADKTVWTWGRNDWGQLGDGTTTSRSTPRRYLASRRG